MTRFTINGVDICLTKKKIKNMYIRIQEPEASVMVSASVHASDHDVIRFIEAHWDWIEEKRQEVLAHIHIVPEKHYETGERHPLWGKYYNLTVQRSLKKPLTQLQGQTIFMRVTARATEEERKKQLDLWYRSELQKVLPPLIEKYEGIVGKHALEWRFRRMKTRWGTCNIQKKRIWLNIQLAEKPMECLEYVIAHELTHLHEAGHNKRFWGLMDQFYPEWRQVKKGLNTEMGESQDVQDEPEE